MTVLDTNVVSELMKNTPIASVVRWSRAQDPSALVTTAVTRLELRYGSARLPAGRRRRAVEQQWTAFLEEALAGVLPIDADAADAAGRFLAHRRAVGKRLEDVRDSLVGGVVLARSRAGAPVTLATRNTADFEHLNDLGDVRLVNPWHYA